MCIIIHKPAGKVLDLKTYENCITEHPDGVGFAYVNMDHIVVEKGLWDLHEFISKIDRIEENNDMLIHFRTASPGMDVSLDNCHPFLFKSDDIKLEDGTPRYEFAIVHNGRLNWRSTKEKSDTRFQIEDMIQPMLANFPDIVSLPVWPHIIFRCINHGYNDTNKMAIMILDRMLDEYDIQIVNEKAGQNEYGCWFSNYTFRYSKPAKTPFQEARRFDGYGYGEDYDAVHPAVQKAMEREAKKRKAEEGSKDGLADLLAKRFPAFVKPDQFGWVWDFECHEWYNVNTKVYMPHLSMRPAPYEPALYKKFWDRKYLPQAAIVVSDKPTTVNGKPIPEDPPPMSGNPFQKPGENIIKHTPIPPVLPTQTTIPNLTVVNVPRDSDVLDAIKEQSIEHLKPNERGILCHEATSYLRSIALSQTQIKKFKSWEKIHALREAVRAAFPDVYGTMADEMLDRELLTAIENDSINRDKFYGVEVGAPAEAPKAEEMKN